jgi:hypothetical protein
VSADGANYPVMDFTHTAYDQLLSAIVGAGYQALTLRRALTGADLELPFILRHDVEWDLKRTLAIVEIEKRHGMRSSLYFRVDTKVYDLPTMRRLQDDGFEIGYHYNTLDRCRGDFSRAITLFEQDIKRLRDAGLKIDTVIPHGDPRVKKGGYTTNEDIIAKDPELPARTGLLDINAGIAARFPGHKYVRDLGIRWNAAGSGRELIAFIREKRWPAIYMLTHPDYWSASFLRAVGLQFAARALRGFGLNRKIAAVRSIAAPRSVGPQGGS